MTRRSFSALLAAAGDIDIATPELNTSNEALSGINRCSIFINQVGYTICGAKKVVVESSIDELGGNFFLRDTESIGDGKTVYEGKLQRFTGDFGTHYICDFSEFQKPGKYVVTVPVKGLDEGASSQTFEISADVYRDAISKALTFYALQRCGPSTTGYHSPCHLDDGLRAETGEFLDVTGGWHDASDLLKWTNATIVNLVALPHVANLSQDPKLRARVYEEAQWGNLYFRKLQDRRGYIYEHGVGGDPVAEGNHFTDNMRHTADDRKVVTRVGSPAVQHMFITAQAHLWELYRDWDRPYLAGCIESAKRCFAWVSSQDSREYIDFGTGAHAAAQLFRATEDPIYLAYALKMGNSFADLQETRAQLQGYFYADQRRAEGASHIFHSPLALIGFARAAELLKDATDIARWKHSLKLCCDQYLARMVQRNAFGIVPFQVQLPEALQPGARGLDGATYRYFMSPLNGKWWVGSNASLAGTGVALAVAARVLESEIYSAMAQRMLDWILGQNPFDVSMMIGVGHKNPPEYIFTGYQPRTPRAPGGVICGIVGDRQDRPNLLPGSYHSCELWSPMMAQTIWLASELMTG